MIFSEESILIVKPYKMQVVGRYMARHIFLKRNIDLMGESNRITEMNCFEGCKMSLVNLRSINKLLGIVKDRRYVQRIVSDKLCVAPCALHGRISRFI